MKIIEEENAFKKQNMEDNAYAAEILDKIDEYERNSGEIIKYYTLCYDEHSDFNMLPYSYGTSALYCDWSKNLFLNAHSPNKKYEYFNMPQNTMDLYFSGKDWKVCNLDEQIVFIDDATYICVY